MIKLNDKPINVTIFPDQTSQVWKLDEKILLNESEVVVNWKFETEAEFLHLAQLKMLLDKNDIRSSLTLEYLPYGRQDKKVNNNTTFALQTFAKLLNSLEFDSITIVDPHSKKAQDLITNSQATYPNYTVYSLFQKLKANIVLYPDEGALHKYADIYSLPYNYGTKVRDQSTGNIINYEIRKDTRGGNILIVDDICDGGATFKILTQKLLESGAIEVNLFVTHGLFSKGLQTLKDSGIKRIFTKDGEASEVQGEIVYDPLYK